MAGIFGKSLCTPSVWSRINLPIRTGKALIDSIAASGVSAARLSSVPPESDKKVQAFGKLINVQPDDNKPGNTKATSLDCRAGSPDPKPKSLRERLVGDYHANPHLYNSFHRISLNADNSVQLADGCAQFVKCNKMGQWEVTESRVPGKYTLHITNLKDASDNHQRSKPDCKNIAVDFKIVDGRKTMTLEAPVKTRPIITCFSKLVFDQDPFKLVYGDSLPPPWHGRIICQRQKNSGIRQRVLRDVRSRT